MVKGLELRAFRVYCVGERGIYPPLLDFKFTDSRSHKPRPRPSALIMALSSLNIINSKPYTPNPNAKP